MRSVGLSQAWPPSDGSPHTFGALLGELARVLERRARLEDRSRGAIVRIALAEHLEAFSTR